MRTFTQSISSSQNAEFGGGNFFMLIETSGVCDVEFFRNGTSIAKANAVEAGYKSEFIVPFTRVDVSTPAPQTVKVGISSEGRGGYDRLIGSVAVTALPANLGTVAVTSMPTIEGDAFFGGQAITVTTGKRGKVQILNPISSGVKIHIDDLLVSMAGPMIIQVREYNTALPGTITNNKSKIIGNPQGAALIRIASDSNFYGSIMADYRHVTEPVFRQKFERPIILNEGKGISISGQENSSFGAYMNWREIPI